MEASGQQDQPVQDEAAVADAPPSPANPEEVATLEVGNGIVVVCGLFESGAVVDLVTRGPNDLRAGGETVGRRVVNDNGEVGFDGLTPGDLYFATGYSGGRYEQVRCVAQDPSSGITLLQPPEQPVETKIGTQQEPEQVVPPAEPEEELPVGLPEGVTSPILEEDYVPEPPAPSEETAPEQAAPESSEELPAQEPEQAAEAQTTEPEASVPSEPQPDGATVEADVEAQPVAEPASEPAEPPAPEPEPSAAAATEPPADQPAPESEAPPNP